MAPQYPDVSSYDTPGVYYYIEWAIDKEGKIWILQSRPITTL